MKEKQKKILSEMMQEDEKSGLYDDTIEQAAKNFYPVETNDLICSPKLVRDAFLAGALWQQKQMYSEEEARKIWHAGQEYWKTSGESITFEELIEHFKKNKKYDYKF